MNEHLLLQSGLWALIEHTWTALLILGVVWRFVRKKFRQEMRAAVRAEIAPLVDKVNDMYPLYEAMKKYVDPKKANGSALKKGAVGQ